MTNKTLTQKTRTISMQQNEYLNVKQENQKLTLKEGKA